MRRTSGWCWAAAAVAASLIAGTASAENTLYSLHHGGAHMPEAGTGAAPSEAVGGGNPTSAQPSAERHKTSTQA